MIQSKYKYISVLFVIVMLIVDCKGRSESNNQIQHELCVKFKVDNEVIRIDDNFKVLFFNKYDTIKAIVVGNQLKIPALNSKDTIYTLQFRYKQYVLSFDSLTKSMIIPDQNIEWEFGIDNRPFDEELKLMFFHDCKDDKKINQLQYLKYNLKEYGDGIELIRSRNATTHK